MGKTCPVCKCVFKDSKHKDKVCCSVKCRSIYRTKKLSICNQCSKSFIPHHGDSSRFCNRECYNQYRIETRPLCLNCGKRVPHNLSRKYCDHKCKVEHKKPKPKYCTNCGVWFSSIKLHPNGKYIATTCGKTCSYKCHIERIKTNQDRKDKISKAFKGSSHPNWQGGRTALNITTHRGSGWNIIAEKVRTRDNHTCQACGKSQEDNGRKLDVHHKTSYHDINDSKKANRLSNLITLCKSCHRKEENKNKTQQIILPFASIARELRHSAAFAKIN